jgi:hypothetical protein
MLKQGSTPKATDDLLFFHRRPFEKTLWQGQECLLGKILMHLRGRHLSDAFC